jgi:hypothetical protein
MSTDTSEIDLEETDTTLGQVLSTFMEAGRSAEAGGSERAAAVAGTDVSADVSTAYEPFSLSGFADVELRGRFEHQPDARLFVWVVKALVRDRVELGTVVMRYAMSAEELGDVWTDLPRCEMRLGKYAEAHLRADLHLLRQGYFPVAASGLTRIDRRGWAEGG